MGAILHELIFLAGMATYPGAGRFREFRTELPKRGGFRGRRPRRYDGLPAGWCGMWQDPYNNLSLPLPFPDALQEFKVETSAAPAQYGVPLRRDGQCRYQIRHQRISR